MKRLLIHQSLTLVYIRREIERLPHLLLVKLLVYGVWVDGVTQAGVLARGAENVATELFKRRLVLSESGKNHILYSCTSKGKTT